MNKSRTQQATEAMREALIQKATGNALERCQDNGAAVRGYLLRAESYEATARELMCPASSPRIAHGEVVPERGSDVKSSFIADTLEISSVPTLFEQEQLLIGNALDVVGHGLRKQLIQRHSLEHSETQYL